VTGHDDIAYNEDDNETSQLFVIATTILDECKDSSPLSDFDTTIYLISEALDRIPAANPCRVDLRKDLAGALITRFSLTKQEDDLDHFLYLWGEVVHKLSISTLSPQDQDIKFSFMSVCSPFSFF
jgi:hypothetical protein